MSLHPVVFQLLVTSCSIVAATLSTFQLGGPRSLVSLFPAWGARRIAQAVIHWIAAIASFVGMAVPFLVFFASAIAFASAVPLALRASRLKTAGSWALPGLLAFASVAAAFAQPLGLKVLALPKADDLNFHPVPSRVVKTYDEGLWFEGIAAGENGTLYLSGNRGFDFSQGDFYRKAQGELIARRPDGSEKVIFKTLMGHTAGVPLVMGDGSIFLTSLSDTPCVWHIDTGGKAMGHSELPPGAWPNGLDLGPDGQLYSADSYLGLIWRVDANSGRAEVALRDPALRARPFVSLAPGANGLHFIGHDLLVTVSDATTVLRYPMESKGGFGPATVIASGIPGDDFAIGQDGSLFITTHPYNTIVRVRPDGERTIVGKTGQHIVGATDAVFGKTVQDQTTLYVVTDGGAFSGGQKARGELVALEPYAKP